MIAMTRREGEAVLIKGATDDPIEIMITAIAPDRVSFLVTSSTEQHHALEIGGSFEFHPGMTMRVIAITAEGPSPKTRLAFDAPKGVEILRKELWSIR